MPIPITCPSCRATFQVQDHLSGSSTRCTCGTTIQVSKATTSGADPLGLNPETSHNVRRSGWSATRRGSYADSEERGLPGWVLPVVGVFLTAVLVGGGYILLQGDPQTTADSESTTDAPPVVIEESSDPTPDVTADSTGTELPADTSAGVTPPPERVTNSIGMELVRVKPKGGQILGTDQPSGDSAKDESPAHKVNFNLPLLFGVHEVTQSQFTQVMNANPSQFRGDNHPVDSVSWDQAREFCRALSRLPAERAASRAYRLPTEAEWEYYARAGEDTDYHFGDDPQALAAHGWYFDNSSGSTQPVGKKNANPLGVHDLLGNVWEWCSDWYQPGYYRAAPEDSPRGPRRGNVRVLRGGSWANGTSACRDGFRFFCHPAVSNSRIGFRVVCIPATGNPANALTPSEIPATTLSVSTAVDLAQTTLASIADGKAEAFDALVPDRVDLTRLPANTFDKYPCRAVAIKDALVHYQRIPQNLRFVMGLCQNEAAKRYGITWSDITVDDVQAATLEGTTGLEHCHAIQVTFRSGQRDDLRYRFYINGAASFNGRWKLTNRISHDAVRPLYAEGLPTADLIVKNTGYATTPSRPFTDDGLGVFTYDPLSAIPIALPEDQVHSKGLAFNINAGLIAYAYDVRTSTEGHPAIAQDGRVTVWNAVTGAVVMDDKWTHEEITATRRDLVDETFARQQMKVQFTNDSTRLALGRDRVIFWDLAQRKKIEGTNPPGRAWKLSESGEAVADESAMPREESTVQSPSGKYHLVGRRQRGAQGQIQSELQLLGPDNEEVKKVVLSGELPRLVFTDDDRPLAIKRQFIFDVATEHVLAEKHRWNHEQQFGESSIEDVSGNQQRMVTRYGRSFNRWLLRVWDVASGREIFVPNEGLDRFDFSPDKRHALSPDGVWLAVADRNRIKFWRIFDPLRE